MNPYYFISKEFVSLHFNIPIDYLGDYVLTQRRSGTKDTFGLGIRIDTKSSRQTNMFIDLMEHKICETSCASSAQWCKIHPIRSQIQYTDDELLIDVRTVPPSFGVRGMLENRTHFEFSYAALEKQYQKYWFDNQVLNHKQLPDNEVFTSLTFYARHFNIPESWLHWAMMIEANMQQVIPVIKIRNTNKIINLYAKEIEALDRRKLILAKENTFFRAIDSDGYECYLLMSKPGTLGKDTDMRLFVREETLRSAYHDRLYTPRMRPLPLSKTTVNILKKAGI